MASLPTDSDIRARAESLGLIDTGAALPPDVRRRMARELQDEATASRAPEPALTLLSRATHDVPGGQLRIDVVFIPTPTPKEPTHG